MPGQQRELQGPAGVCEPSGSPGNWNQINSKPGKFKTKTTEGEITKYGAENQGKKEVTKTAVPLGRARPGCHNERRGG